MGFAVVILAMLAFIVGGHFVLPDVEPGTATARLGGAAGR